MDVGNRVKLSETGRTAHHTRLHVAEGEVIHVSGETVSVRWNDVRRRSGGKGLSSAAKGPATTTGHILHFEYVQ